MRILLFGGTRFLGRSIAEVALARGHELTLFHRGLSNPTLWPDARHVRGNRETDLHLLAGEDFDVVIDTCGFEVFSVRKSARAVGAARYIFVSSISVYADRARMDEESAVL